MSGIGRETLSLPLLRHSSPPQKIIPIGRGPRDLKLNVQKIPLVLEANWSNLIRSISPGTRSVRDDRWPRSRRQRNAVGDRTDRNSSTRRSRLPTRTGEGRAKKGRDRIAMPRYTSDRVGTRDDFVRLTWMPSSVHTVRSLSPRL